MLRIIKYFVKSLKNTQVIGNATIQSYTNFCWCSIVTMALSCIISEIKQRDIGRKSRFFHTPLHSTPPLWGLRRNNTITFGYGKN